MVRWEASERAAPQTAMVEVLVAPEAAEVDRALLASLPEASAGAAPAGIRAAGAAPGPYPDCNDNCKSKVCQEGRTRLMIA